MNMTDNKTSQMALRLAKGTVTLAAIAVAAKLTFDFGADKYGEWRAEQDRLHQAEVTALETQRLKELAARETQRLQELAAKEAQRIKALDATYLGDDNVNAAIRSKLAALQFVVQDKGKFASNETPAHFFLSEVSSPTGRKSALWVGVADWTRPGYRPDGTTSTVYCRSVYAINAKEIVNNNYDPRPDFINTKEERSWARGTTYHDEIAYSSRFTDCLDREPQVATLPAVREAPVAQPIASPNRDTVGAVTSLFGDTREALSLNPR